MVQVSGAKNVVANPPDTHVRADHRTRGVFLGFLDCHHAESSAGHGIR